MWHCEFLDVIPPEACQQLMKASVSTNWSLEASAQGFWKTLCVYSSWWTNSKDSFCSIMGAGSPNKPLFKALLALLRLLWSPPFPPPPLPHDSKHDCNNVHVNVIVCLDAHVAGERASQAYRRCWLAGCSSSGPTASFNLIHASSSVESMAMVMRT